MLCSGCWVLINVRHLQTTEKTNYPAQRSNQLSPGSSAGGWGKVSLAYFLPKFFRKCSERAQSSPVGEYPRVRTSVTFVSVGVFLHALFLGLLCHSSGTEGSR